jgi:hypothetical protein
VAACTDAPLVGDDYFNPVVNGIQSAMGVKPFCQ